tara:strand:+ start:10025 stop:10831 length:807 start_codon:yes stop_codon:yes gene_type:complete
MVNSIVVDPIEDNETDEDYASLEQDTGDEIQSAEEEEQVAEYEVPSKFQGKSVEDIVNSYAALEKELGRKGQEIGELRKLSDEFLKSQLQANQQNNPQSAEEETDFFEDPQAAIRREIDNHPKIKEAELAAAKSQQQATMQQLEQQHPDAQQTVQSPEFQEWISQSKIRQRMFNDANNYDFESANELLSNWKERKLITKTHEVENAQKESKKQALKAGKAESRSSGDSVGGKKIYRRSDLIRLKQTDPNRYDSLADEIYQAYAEGRVK